VGNALTDSNLYQQIYCCKRKYPDNPLNVIRKTMEYILIEKFIFESIIARLKDCASEVAKLKQNFGVKPLDDWIDNQTAQRLLKRGQRTLQTLRSTGKLGYSIIEGKVFYPRTELMRYLAQSKVTDG